MTNLERIGSVRNNSANGDPARVNDSSVVVQVKEARGLILKTVRFDTHSQVRWRSGGSTHPEGDVHYTIVFGCNLIQRAKSKRGTCAESSLLRFRVAQKFQKTKDCTSVERCFVDGDVAAIVSRRNT